jgi:hypothetical protein
MMQRITVEQALQAAERIKREEIQRKKEEEHRQEEERQRLAAEEADKIARTQLPVRLDALFDEGTAHSDGLTFVKSVSRRIRSIYVVLITVITTPFFRSVYR